MDTHEKNPIEDNAPHSTIERNKNGVKLKCRSCKKTKVLSTKDVATVLSTYTVYCGDCVKEHNRTAGALGNSGGSGDSGDSGFVLVCNGNDRTADSYSNGTLTPDYSSLAISTISANVSDSERTADSYSNGTLTPDYSSLAISTISANVSDSERTADSYSNGTLTPDYSSLAISTISANYSDSERTADSYSNGTLTPDLSSLAISTISANYSDSERTADSYSNGTLTSDYSRYSQQSSTNNRISSTGDSLPSNLDNMEGSQSLETPADHRTSFSETQFGPIILPALTWGARIGQVNNITQGLFRVKTPPIDYDRAPTPSVCDNPPFKDKKRIKFFIGIGIGIICLSIFGGLMKHFFRSKFNDFIGNPIGHIFQSIHLQEQRQFKFTDIEPGVMQQTRYVVVVPPLRDTNGQNITVPINKTVSKRSVDETGWHLNYIIGLKQLNVTGPSATCGSNGVYTILLQDDTGLELLTLHATITIKYENKQSSLTISGNDVTCSQKFGCNKPNMDALLLIDGREESIPSQESIITYTDIDGYHFTMSTQIPAELKRLASTLICRSIPKSASIEDVTNSKQSESTYVLNVTPTTTTRITPTSSPDEKCSMLSNMSKDFQEACSILGTGGLFAHQSNCTIYHHCKDNYRVCNQTCAENTYWKDCDCHHVNDLCLENGARILTNQSSLDLRCHENRTAQPDV